MLKVSYKLNNIANNIIHYIENNIEKRTVKNPERLREKKY